MVYTASVFFSFFPNRKRMYRWLFVHGTITRATDIERVDIERCASRAASFSAHACMQCSLIVFGGKRRLMGAELMIALRCACVRELFLLAVVLGFSASTFLFASGASGQPCRLPLLLQCLHAVKTVVSSPCVGDHEGG